MPSATEFNEIVDALFDQFVEALDSADLVAMQMRADELQLASQVLGQIFRDYLLQLQGNPSLFAPTPAPAAAP